MPSSKVQALLRELAANAQRREELEALLAAEDAASPPPRPPRASPNGCTHKVAADFISGRTSEGRAIWRCSKCGAEDQWRNGWVYYGTIECEHCLRAKIERVYCPACAQGRSN